MSDMNPWIRIVRVSEIPLREGRAVKVGNREIAIFNLGDRFLAVENRCPHKSGPLADGIVSGTNVVCPLHAWKFSLETGAGVSAPSATSCVETFPTRVEGDIVSVKVTSDAILDRQTTSESLPEICLQPAEAASMTTCSS